MFGLVTGACDVDVDVDVDASYIYACMQYGNDNETILYSHSTVRLYYVREMGDYDDSMDRETEMRKFGRRKRVKGGGKKGMSMYRASVRIVEVKVESEEEDERHVWW